MRRTCKSCLLLLSVPTVHREAATHASIVLVHLARASWRASGRWPLCAASPSVDAAAATADASKPQSSAPREERGADLRLSRAATTVSRSFFPTTTKGPGEDGVAGEGAGETDNGTADALIAGFMPLLPPAPALAVCRALLHVVHPRVLLANLGQEGEGRLAEAARPAAPAVAGEGGGRGLRTETEAGGDVDGGSDLAGVELEEGGATGGRSLMLGPILRVVLRHGGAGSGLSLRFLALQVRVEANALFLLPSRRDCCSQVCTGAS